ncbi:hypothetical protein [Gloeocapsa sp. BRSZ]
MTHSFNYLLNSTMVKLAGTRNHING